MWQYGLTAETTDDWVTMASALMEAYCRRPSLLVTQYMERMRLTAGCTDGAAQLSSAGCGRWGRFGVGGSEGPIWPATAWRAA